VRQSREGRNVAMLTRLMPTMLGAALVFAITAGSASAADEIEAKVQTCNVCHGANGVPLDPKTMPIIWGQQQSYLMKQLRNYRNGERASPIMTPLAKGLAEDDLRKIAAYFAAKPWPALPAPAAAVSPPQGIAQCQPCHQPNFEGGMPAPRLAGLSYEYLVAAMKNFATSERTNNLDMPGFMHALSDGERDAMARYLASLR
jgi:cytochrome c553